MKSHQTAMFAFVLVAIMAAYWAYTSIDTLIRRFSGQITYVDLAVIFILGLISGIGVGLAYALWRGNSSRTAE